MLASWDSLQAWSFAPKAARIRTALQTCSGKDTAALAKGGRLENTEEMKSSGDGVSFSRAASHDADKNGDFLQNFQGLPAIPEEPFPPTGCEQLTRDGPWRARGAATR